MCYKFQVHAQNTCIQHSYTKITQRTFQIAYTLQMKKKMLSHKRTFFYICTVHAYSATEWVNTYTWTASICLCVLFDFNIAHEWMNKWIRANKTKKKHTRTYNRRSAYLCVYFSDTFYSFLRNLKYAHISKHQVHERTAFCVHVFVYYYSQTSIQSKTKRKIHTHVCWSVFFLRFLFHESENEYIHINELCVYASLSRIRMV